MPATIRDVARQAGVSIATVSRVMRDSKDVRPDTRDRVMAAAAELHYTPSQLGRQLAERRHAANGIVFPDLSGPYYAEVVLGYEAVAAELRRSVLILSTHGRDDAEAAVRDMAGRCDGLVVLGRTVSDDVVEALAARGTSSSSSPGRRSATSTRSTPRTATAPSRSPTTCSTRAPAGSPSSATPTPRPTSPSAGRASGRRSTAASTTSRSSWPPSTTSTRRPAPPSPRMPSSTATCPTPSSAPTTSSPSA